MAESSVSEGIVRARPEGFGPSPVLILLQQESANYSVSQMQPRACFYKYSFTGTQLPPFIYMPSVTAFFPSTVPELSSCHRDSMAFKPCYLLSNLYRKGAEPRLQCRLHFRITSKESTGCRATLYTSSPNFQDGL